MLQRLTRRFAKATGRSHAVYLRICNPGGLEYAEFLRRQQHFLSVGNDCYISPDANISDPAYVKIGNNVRINECAIFGHDGAVNMINKALGLQLDRVGKIDLRDNVYLGYRCIILPGVTIGPNAIVAAGAVVSRDVPQGSIVAGNPAKQVSTLEAYVEKLKASNIDYPWRSLIEQRKSEFDPKIEPELVRLRVKHFYPSERRQEPDARRPLKVYAGSVALIAILPVLFLFSILLDVMDYVEARSSRPPSPVPPDRYHSTTGPDPS